MYLSNQKPVESIVGAEMIELSLEHLASVSGGGGPGNTVSVIGDNCKASKPQTDKAGNTTIIVTCQADTHVSYK